MKLTFIGATHEVTGSCFYLEAAGKHLLVDCGMEQGPNDFENQEIPIPANEIDYVLQTHAHIDHSGLLPLLYKNGFRGEIHATNATTDLCNIMLRDSAHIQEFEAEWRNRKGKRAGQDEFIPLYTMEDAEGALEKFIPHSYDKRFSLCEGIDVNFVDVGHLLGSASIEVWVTEENTAKKFVFSGDIGNLSQPLLRDPDYISDADYVIMESTYGDRSHGPKPDYAKDLAAVIQRTFDRGGNVVIPSFAVGRTQEMLYFIRHIKENGLVKGFDSFPVYVDSPLAIEATGIFNEKASECFDEEALDLVRRGINPIGFEGLKLTVTSDESKSINFDKSPKVIISASGMCDAGRIKHHLKHNLWRKESTILFVGYQANGSLGRSILDGAPTVKLFGEPINIQAEIARLPGVSGHADHDGLIAWLTHMSPKPEHVFVVHGEDEVCEAFKDEIIQMGYTASAPYSGARFNFLTAAWEVEEGPVPFKKSYAAEKAESMFTRLVAAGRRLMLVIENNKGGSNKELARFSDQINSLCDRWDR